jgi:hypothetical protein
VFASRRIADGAPSQTSNEIKDITMSSRMESDSSDLHGLNETIVGDFVEGAAGEAEGFYEVPGFVFDDDADIQPILDTRPSFPEAKRLCSNEEGMKEVCSLAVTSQMPSNHD